MAGKNPKEAADNFIFYFKETLSCLSGHYVKAFRQTEKLYKIFYDPYADLVAKTANYKVSITQVFRVTPHPENQQEFKARTQEYSYVLLEESGEKEIVAYHWHPNDPGVHYPHLHIPGSHVHFPTSRVCLEDFIHMLHRDYEVKRNMSQADCKKILEKNKKAFEKGATWKVQHR